MWFVYFTQNATLLHIGKQTIKSVWLLLSFVKIMVIFIKAHFVMQDNKIQP